MCLGLCPVEKQQPAPEDYCKAISWDDRTCCTHELTATVVAYPRLTQDQTSHYPSIEGAGAHKAPSLTEGLPPLRAVGEGELSGQEVDHAPVDGATLRHTGTAMTRFTGLREEDLDFRQGLGGEDGGLARGDWRKNRGWT